MSRYFSAEVTRLVTAVVAPAAVFTIFAGVAAAQADKNPLATKLTSSEEAEAPSSTTVAEGHGGKTAGGSQGSAAQRAFVDPKTGRLGVPPAKGRRTEALAPSAAFSTSDEGLVETLSPEPGGGVMVDLQGRFQSPLTITRDSDGNVRIEHVPSVPASDGKE